MANDNQNLDGLGNDTDDGANIMSSAAAYQVGQREADCSRTGPPADAATRGTHVPASIDGVPGTELNAPWPLPVDTY